jgi:hypothetical protein
VIAFLNGPKSRRRALRRDNQPTPTLPLCHASTSETDSARVIAFIVRAPSRPAIATATYQQADGSAESRQAREGLVTKRQRGVGVGRGHEL